MPHVEAVRILQAAEPSDEAFEEAGVATAAALALVYDDDERNIRAALTARRLNPRVRLVIRLYNRKLGQHLETLLDQAAAVASPGIDQTVLDASTTVLSDADTAAPALAATALSGSSKVIRAEGLLLRASERTPPRDGQAVRPALCTLALLSSTTHDPAGTEGSDSSGDEGPRLLPDQAEVAAATGRGTIVLEAVEQARAPPAASAGWGQGRPAGPGLLAAAALVRAGRRHGRPGTRGGVHVHHRGRAGARRVPDAARPVRDGRPCDR